MTDVIFHLYLQEVEDSDDGDDDEDKEDEEVDESDEDGEESDEEEEEEEEDPLNISSSMLGGDSEISAMSEDVSLPSSISITPITSSSKKPPVQQKEGTIGILEPYLWPGFLCIVLKQGP